MAKERKEDISPVYGLTEETTIETGAIDETAAPESIEATSARYVVTTRFCFEEDFSRYYEVGEDVSHFDAKRINDLKNQLLIKEVH